MNEAGNLLLSVQQLVAPSAADPPTSRTASMQSTAATAPLHPPPSRPLPSPLCPAERTACAAPAAPRTAAAA